MIERAQGEFPRMIIYGCGGHGRALLEVVRAMGTYRVVGFVDDNPPAVDQYLGVPILGGQEVLPDLLAQGVSLAANGIGGIGAPHIRWQAFNRLESLGFHFPTIVHPSAVMEPSAQLMEGVQVLQLAYVGTQAKVGKGSVVNVHAVLCHDADIGTCANFSPGALLAGNVKIGDFTQVGMGATININLSIGAHVRIGNNATVKSDVPDGTVVRAGTIWPLPSLSRLGLSSE